MLVNSKVNKECGCYNRKVLISNHSFISSLETRTVTSHHIFFPGISNKHLCILTNFTGVPFLFPHHSIEHILVGSLQEWLLSQDRIMELYVVRLQDTLGHSSLGQGWMCFLLCYAALCEPGGIKFTLGNVDMG